MGMRRRAREAALQVLYQLDVQPDLAAEVALARFHANFTGDGDAHPSGAPASAGFHDAESEPARPVSIPPEVRSYLEKLVLGVVEHLAEIDARITRASRNWRLERMARVDRNLLRLAVHEMAFCD